MHAARSWPRAAACRRWAATRALPSRCPPTAQYTIELHDAVFRGDEPGFFRLKIGDFRYADMVYPLAVQQATDATFEFLATNLPADARATAKWTPSDGLAARMFCRRPGRPRRRCSPARGRRCIVTDHAEIDGSSARRKAARDSAPRRWPSMAASASQKRAGSLSSGGHAGAAVAVRRAGPPGRFNARRRAVDSKRARRGTGRQRRSPRHERSGSRFQGAGRRHARSCRLRDLQGRGGADFVYRISVDPVGTPDFSLCIADDRVQVPKDGAGTGRACSVERAGYDGPIELSFPNCRPVFRSPAMKFRPEPVEALVTLQRAGVEPGAVADHRLSARARESRHQTPRRVAGDAGEQASALARHDVALAVTTPSPLQLAWDLFAADAKLASGRGLPIKLRVNAQRGREGRRAALAVDHAAHAAQEDQREQRGAAKSTTSSGRSVSRPRRRSRPIRAKPPPRSSFPAICRGSPTIWRFKPNCSPTTTRPSWPRPSRPLRRLPTIVPMTLELASQTPVEARAGVGPDRQTDGQDQPSRWFRAAGQPDASGSAQGSGLAFAYRGRRSIGFRTCRRVSLWHARGRSGQREAVGRQPDRRQATPSPRFVPTRSAVAVNVVAGEKPPMEKPLAVFEDQPEFVANLTEGGGQATLDAEEKYSGAASVKVTPDQRFNPALPGLSMKIREKPSRASFATCGSPGRSRGDKPSACSSITTASGARPADKPGQFPLPRRTARRMLRRFAGRRCQRARRALSS